MKKIIFLAFFFLLFQAGVSSAKAAEYYVSTSGADTNSGTITSPFRTIQKAANIMIAGDTVYVRGGTYPEQVTPKNSGNATGGHITYTTYSGETVTLDGTGLTLTSPDPNYSNYKGLFTIIQKNYIRVSGFRLINSKSTGIVSVYASNLIFENNYTYDTFTSGIAVWGGSNIVINHNEIDHACNGGGDELLTVGAWASYVEVMYNNVHHGQGHLFSAGGEGINIKDGCHDVKVHDNISHDNLRKYSIGVDANSQETYNIEFYRNISYNNGEGIIVESEQGGLCRNIKVYNNLSYNNSGSGFYMPQWGASYGLKKDIYFVNNVAYGNGKGINIYQTNVENVVIRNNILSNNGNNPQITIASGMLTNPIVDHNLFYNSTTTLGTNSVTGDPKFVNAAAADFRLQAGSPAINVGSSLNAPSTDFAGITRPQGEGYDIGAYEYQGTSPTATTAPSSSPSPTLTIKAGDANGDGLIDSADYAIWFNHYGTYTVNGYEDGDFNSDQKVDGIDYVIWLNNYGK